MLAPKKLIKNLPAASSEENLL